METKRIVRGCTILVLAIVAIIATVRTVTDMSAAYRASGELRSLSSHERFLLNMADWFANVAYVGVWTLAIVLVLGLIVAVLSLILRRRTKEVPDGTDA